jgi:transcriptional regulator with XRE-family HTH domain
MAMANGELGAFVRRQREALAPVQVGLPHGRRRRTPGLRRSELAALADISVDYLTRIEQGRDTHPSPSVLAALAKALMLCDEDVDYLHRLAVANNGNGLCPKERAPARSIRPTVQTLLDRLGSTPAFVVNHLSDLLAWTPAFELVVRPLGILEHKEPNLLRYIFTDSRAHAAFLDWECIANEQVVNLYVERRNSDDRVHEFADVLAHGGGAEFVERWARGGVARKASGTAGLIHPEVGVLRLAFEELKLPDRDRQQLVAYLPADAITAARLARLVGRRPGGLRSVDAG